MGCKKNLVWVLVSVPTQTCKNKTVKLQNCRRSLVSIYSMLFQKGAHRSPLQSVSKTDVQKQISLQLKHVAKPRILARVGKSSHSSFVCEKRSCHGNIHMFPCSLLGGCTKHIQNSKRCLQKLILSCTLLSWFEIKPSFTRFQTSFNSNGLSSTSTMSSYMTSSVPCSTKCLLIGLWCERTTRIPADRPCHSA